MYIKSEKKISWALIIGDNWNKAFVSPRCDKRRNARDKRIPPRSLICSFTSMQNFVQNQNTGEKGLAPKSIFGISRGNCKMIHWKDTSFPFFLLPQHDNFLSLFQFVSGCRSEREVCSINGTGSLAYSRSGSKYYYI